MDVRIASTVVIRYPEVVSIGDHVAIDDFTYITTSTEVGSYVHIGPHCSIIGGKQAQCFMEDFSGLAAGCRLVCASGDLFGGGLMHPWVPAAYRGEIHVCADKITKVRSSRHPVRCSSRGHAGRGRGGG